ncbi:MAG TPA: O-antigen ligase family protein [Vicinamibacterales bacterium]|nr:O-antigen ligase family protein [Vicinamibacterales bacterium]
MERLTFNIGRGDGQPVVAGRAARARAAAAAHAAPVAPTRERYDWDYLWLVAFTAVLFFRPQDQVPGLEVLHLAELTAIFGLAAMAVRRLGAGLPIAHVNTELVGVIALGGVILLSVPFSIWPGGSAHVFTDIYVKIILIFALMMSTLTSPKRLQQMTWLMIVASSYIAGRAIFDYVRGVNLVEGNRVRGAVGGMFENPNDLALNLVTFLAPTLFIIMQDRRPSRRMFAALCAVLMVGAIVCTKSRSGFLGLLAMGAVVAFYTVRVRPGYVIAGVLACALAVPVMPSSFWDRMDSIMNGEEDTTGSREARIRLFNQGVQVFIENPIIGVGAGQFKNYYDPGVTAEKWRVTHDVWLQVASELGILGLFTFGFLVIRSYGAALMSLRLLRGRRRAPPPPLAPADRVILDQNAKGMLAAVVGWTVCSFFASVAFNWTFYYVFALAVAGREILTARIKAGAPAEAPVDVRARRAVGARGFGRAAIHA